MSGWTVRSEYAGSEVAATWASSRKTLYSAIPSSSVLALQASSTLLPPIAVAVIPPDWLGGVVSPSEPAIGPVNWA